jgi:hypothetical protein
VRAGGQCANDSGPLNLKRGGGISRGQGNAGFGQGTWLAERRPGYAAKAGGPRGPIYNYMSPAYRYAPHYPGKRERALSVLFCLFLNSRR